MPIACVTGGIDTGCVVECLHLQSGIVGKAIITVMLLDVTGFLEGVALQGVGRLGDVVVAVDVGQAHDAHQSLGDFPHLVQLMCVICRKY